ncbi:MAG: hypothetical protein RR911_03270 [Oscillospiraceae bacterium]
MNKLKNKDGSAILWTVLLSVIITILLGTLLTLAFGYHNSTITSVKRKQAYFTARSATDMIISELMTNGSESRMMPVRNGAKTQIDNFGFTKDMGTASAEIKRASGDSVKVKVTSKYADIQYTMNATLRNQSLYFGGIAVKSLSVPETGNFTLTTNTDLYVDNDAGFNCKINIGGNVVSKGNITLRPFSQVAGTTFNKETTYDKDVATANPRKQIWSSTKFIISNHTLDAKYQNIIQTPRMLVNSFMQGNYNSVLSYTRYSKEFNPNFINDFFLSKGTLSNNARYIKIKYFDRWLFPDLDTYDITQIDYTKSDAFTELDQVTPIAYVILEDNCKMRVKYGLTQKYGGWLGSMQDFYQWVMNQKITYLNVYLGENAVLELGNTAGSSPEELRRLNFFMSIYGAPTSKVILHNNVVVNGSINVGSLEVKNDATVNYMTSNGGQVAKQKIDEMWVLSNYSD